jgi:hypothetical protein
MISVRTALPVAGRSAALRRNGLELSDGQLGPPCGGKGHSPCIVRMRVFLARGGGSKPAIADVTMQTANGGLRARNSL